MKLLIRLYKLGRTGGGGLDGIIIIHYTNYTKKGANCSLNYNIKYTVAGVVPNDIQEKIDWEESSLY